MNENRVVITLKRRTWLGRILRAPGHFWAVLHIGKGRIPLRHRIVAASVTTWLLVSRKI